MFRLAMFQYQQEFCQFVLLVALFLISVEKCCCKESKRNLNLSRGRENTLACSLHSLMCQGECFKLEILHGQNKHLCCFSFQMTLVQVFPYTHSDE